MYGTMNIKKITRMSLTDMYVWEICEVFHLTSGSALLWGITQSIVVIPYQSHLKGP